MQETPVRFLGWEDALEEGMAIHSSILAWRIPMDREAWRATVHGVAKSRTELRGLALSAAAPDLRRQVTPLGRLPSGMGSSRLLPLASDVGYSSMGILQASWQLEWKIRLPGPTQEEA